MITAMEGETRVYSPLDPELEAMVEAGVHVGHVRSKRHPAMAPYLWGVRVNTDLIDLLQTKEKLVVALAFLRELARDDKLVLFVGTRPSAKEFIRAVAMEFGYPYVDRRWIGGTLTNFKVIRKRIEALEELEQERGSGGFEKYTKKERLVKEQEMGRLVENFDGLRRLTRLPDTLVIIDISRDTLALAEAKRMGIPVVALTDTNADPRQVAYPIPSNDDARPAVAYMVERMRHALREGMAARADVIDAVSAVPETQ